MILPHWRNPIWNLSVFQLVGILVSASLTLSPPGRRPSKLFRVKLLSSLFPADVFLAPFPRPETFLSGQNFANQILSNLSLCDPFPSRTKKEKKLSGMLIIPLLKVHNFTFTPCIQRVQWILAIQVGLCAHLHPLNSSSFTTTCDPYPSHLTLHGPVRVIIALVTSGCLFFDLVCCCSLYDLNVFFSHDSRPKVFLLHPHFLTERYFKLCSGNSSWRQSLVI